MIRVHIAGVGHLVDDESDVRGPPVNTVCGVVVADPLALGGAPALHSRHRNPCADCDRIRVLRKQSAARTTRAMGLGRVKRRK